MDDLQDDGSAIDDPAVQAFDAALEAAIARLPDQYRAQLATVAIVVADEATPDELATVSAAGSTPTLRGRTRSSESRSTS